MASKKLTAAQFEALRPLLGISDRRQDAAREVLVDGDSLRRVAARYEWSHQTVDESVRIVWGFWLKYQQGLIAAAAVEDKLPRGWKRVTVAAPVQMLNKFLADVDALKAAGEKKKARQPVKEPG